MGTHLTPLEVCEALIGPLDRIAAILGHHAKSPYHWRRASAIREAGDLPSLRIVRQLLEHSDAHGLGLLPEHLIFGATRAEIDALLALPPGQRPSPTALPPAEDAAA